VAALETRFRPIRDFIMYVPRFREAFCRFTIKTGEYIIRRDLAVASAPDTALFDVEHVNGNVFGCESFDTIQIFPPCVPALLRQPGDQVNADVAEPMLTQNIDIV